MRVQCCKVLHSPLLSLLWRFLTRRVIFSRYNNLTLLGLICFFFKPLKHLLLFCIVSVSKVLGNDEKLRKQLLNIQESHPFLCSQLWGHSCWHLSYTTRDIVWCHPNDAERGMPEELLEAWYLLPGPRLSLMVGCTKHNNSDSNDSRSTNNMFFKGFHIGIAHFFFQKKVLEDRLMFKVETFHPLSVVALRPKTPRKVFLPGKPWKKSGPEMFRGARSRYQSVEKKLGTLARRNSIRTSTVNDLKYILGSNRKPWNTDVSWSLKDLRRIAITSGSFQILLHYTPWVHPFHTVSSLPGTLNNAWGTSLALRTSAGRNSMQRSVIHSIL